MKSKNKAQNGTIRICGVGITARINKDGITTYQLRKARPRKTGQSRKSEFAMTWKNEQMLTGKRLESALNEQVCNFLQAYEEDISGVISTRTKNITFGEYAQLVMRTKEMQGVKKTTLSGYNSLLVRINERFGGTPIKNISTIDLNTFYADLKDTKVDRSIKALSKVDLLNITKPYYITKVEVSNLTGLSLPTIDACFGTTGKACRKIEYTNAETITNAINFLLFDKEKLAVTNRIREINKLPYLCAPKKPYTVSELFEELEETNTISDKTVREYHRLLSTIFEQAVAEGLIDKNPTSKATPPKLRHKEAQFYEPHEIKKIRECMELDIKTAISTNRQPNYKSRAILYLIMSTGCRRGEIAGLTWDSIDFNNDLIYIRSNLLYTSKYGTYVDTLKTTNSTRTLYLDPTAKAALLDYKSQLEEIKKKNKNRWQESGLVFVQDNGSPINPSSITSWCNRFSKRYDLPHLHPHAFRHTLASVMLSNKSSIIDVSKYLGHSKPSVTSDIYSHMLHNANIELGRDISRVIMGNNENA